MVEVATLTDHGVNNRIALKSGSILIMCLLYMIEFFTESYLIELLLACWMIVVFGLCLRSAKPVPRWFSIVMLLVGCALNIWKGDPINSTINGILTNLPIITLIALVPLISIPLKIGGYLDSVHYVIMNMGTAPRKMFRSISFSIFCLGPILNLGAIRVLHEMIDDLKLNSQFLSKAYLVGFSTVILWSPYFASVAMVLYYLQLPVLSYLPYGLSLAAAQLVMGNVLFMLFDRKVVAASTTQLQERSDTEEEFHNKKLLKLMGILAGLMGSIFVIEYWTGWPMLLLVSLISIAFPIFWLSFNHEWKAFGPHFQHFRTKSVPSLNNEIVLFMSAGLFGKSLAGTNFANGAKIMLEDISNVSFLLFSVTIFVIVFVTSLIGIHQIVTVTLLLTQIDPVNVGTTAPVLALILMVSWSISAVAAPINPLNLLVSNSLKRSSWEVGLKWNGAYLLAMFSLCFGMIYLIHSLIGT